MVNLFNREKRYRIGKLKDYIFLYDINNTKVYHARNEAFWITSDKSYKLHCQSAKFTSSASDAGRYQISSGIEVILDERDKVDNYYLLKEIVSGKWLIGFETVEGEQFLMSPEYPALVSYAHTINDTEVTNNTTLSFNVLTNEPNCKVLTSLPYNEEMRGKACAYSVGRIKSLELAAVNNVTITIGDGTFTVNDKYSDSLCTVKYSPRTLEYKEEYDGEKYTQTLSFDVPFEEYQHSFHYSLLEFLDNKYYAVLTTTNNNYCLAGFPFGMIPSYSVATGENTNVVTITLTYSSSARGMATATDLNINEGNGKRYIAAEQECVNDIYSTVLVEELNNDGTSNGYYCLEGFESNYTLLTLLGTYDSIYTTKFGIKLYDNAVKCITEECSVEGIPSNTTFNNAGEAKTYTVTTDCSLTPLANDNCTLSYSNGKLTITNLQDDGNYTYSLKDGNGYVHTYYVTVQPLQEYMQYIEITAKAQRISVNTEFPLDEIETKTVSSTLTFTPLESNQGWYVDVPTNTSTTVVQEHMITIEYTNGNSEEITISQDHLYKRYVNDGTQLCDGNDLWNYAHRYIGYTSDDINIDSGYEKLSLIEANASLCVTSDDEWIEELYEEVCIDGYIHALNTYVNNLDSNITYNKVVKTSVACDEATETLYERWVVNTDMVVCVDDTAYAYEVKEISTDNSNWFATDEKQASTTTVDSIVCDVEDNTGEGDGSEQASSATIALYALSREIPYSGGNAYLQVDYTNATAIHTPTTNVEWFTITQTQSGSTTNNGQPITQVMYKFTADASSIDRSANVTFSCIGQDDLTVTDSHFKLYQSGAITREVTLDITEGYVCDGTTKYFAIATEVSYDNGVTWTRLDGYTKGDEFEENSTDCGYVDSGSGGGDDTGTTVNPPTITTDTSLLDFPKSGGTRYVTVTYTNTTAVNTPTNSNAWCTISVYTSSMTAANTYVIKYEVVAQATTVARSGVIEFSCVGQDGTSIQSTITAQQSNTSYQTITLDIEEDYTCVGTSKYYTIAHQESNDNGNTWTTTSTELGDLYEENSTDCGYVEALTSSIAVTPTSLSFVSAEDTQQVTVTYTNINEVYAPNASGAWISGTIASNTSTEVDGDTINTVVYYVTANANTATEDRTATLTFSGMGYDGIDYSSTTVNITQTAATPSEDGEIILEDEQIGFTSGASEITTTVIYNNMAGIDSPSSDADWCTVSVDTEGDTAIVYAVIVTQNTVTSSRTATITFSGIDINGNYQEATLLITQSAAPASSGDGEYDITATYNVTDASSSIDLCDSTSNVTSMYIDGVEVTKTSSHTFPTTGNHKVGFNFSIDKIPNNFFDGCDSLTSVEIGSGITTICTNAFYWCDALTSVTIPDSVTTIDSYAFQNCTSLTNVEIPYSATSIGEYAFGDCTSLTSVTIPDSVTSIGCCTFNGCSGLRSTVIACEGIGDCTFGGCTSLTSITMLDSFTYIGDLAFQNCTSLTSVIIPDSVTHIGYSAFNGCTSLASVEIGNGVASVSNNAFNGCTSLTSITCNATTAPSVVYNTFSGVTANGTLYYPCGSDYSTWLSTNNAYLGWYGWNDGCVGDDGQYEIICTYQATTDMSSTSTNLYGARGGIIEMYIDNEQVDVSSGHTFSDYNEHTVRYVVSYNRIVDSTFSGCNALRSVVIGDGITSVGNNAFRYCDWLSSITIPDSVTTIGDNAFSYCEKLTSIDIPDSVTTIGSSFYYCTQLNSISCHATTAPTITSSTFTSIASSGVLYYPSGSDYSAWLDVLGDDWLGIEI